MATILTVRNNGSMRLEGDFVIRDQDGNTFDLGGRTAVSLCRCGATKDAPFCDGGHKTCGFASVVAARALPPIAPPPSGR